MFLKRALLFLPLALLVACASVRSSYIQEVPLVTQAKKEPHSVEYLAHKPSRAALRIGVISTDGNGYSHFDDLLKEAKKKAAKLGGDFILVERSGVDHKMYYSPGYSTYQSNAHACYGHHHGHGNSVAYAYSVGPSMSRVNFPWSVFSVWIYTRAQLGIRLDQENNISEFHLNSNAEQVGLQIGDKLIGIDGYDIRDQKMTQHTIKINPGDRVKITVQRKSKRFDYFVTALPN